VTNFSCLLSEGPVSGVRNLRHENSLRRLSVVAVVDVEVESVGAKHVQVVHHDQLARGRQLQILPDYKSGKE